MRRTSAWTSKPLVILIFFLELGRTVFFYSSSTFRIEDIYRR